VKRYCSSDRKKPPKSPVMASILYTFPADEPPGRGWYKSQSLNIKRFSDAEGLLDDLFSLSTILSLTVIV
jgi:hypothetical protein